MPTKPSPLDVLCECGHRYGVHFLQAFKCACSVCLTECREFRAVKSDDGEGAK